MDEQENTAFSVDDFLAKAGLGRRIVQLKPEHVFFSQEPLLTLSTISRRVARS